MSQLSEYLERSANGDFKELGPVEYISEVMNIIDRAEVSENRLCRCTPCDNPAIVDLDICRMHARQSLCEGNQRSSLHNCREEENIPFLTAEEVIEVYTVYGDSKKFEQISGTLELTKASLLEVLNYLREVEEGDRRSSEEYREEKEKSDGLAPRYITEYDMFKDSDIDQIDFFD